MKWSKSFWRENYRLFPWGVWVLRLTWFDWLFRNQVQSIVKFGTAVQPEVLSATNHTIFTPIDCCQPVDLSEFHFFWFGVIYGNQFCFNRNVDSSWKLGPLGSLQPRQSVTRARLLKATFHAFLPLVSCRISTFKHNPTTGREERLEGLKWTSSCTHQRTPPCSSRPLI